MAAVQETRCKMYVVVGAVPLTKINLQEDLNTAADLFRNNWSIQWGEKDFKHRKNHRAILIGKDNLAFGICKLPITIYEVPLNDPREPELNIKNLEPVLKKAKEFNAEAIIIAKNHDNLDGLSNDKKKKEFIAAKRKIDEYGLILSDILYITPSECLSYKQNLQGVKNA